MKNIAEDMSAVMIRYLHSFNNLIVGGWVRQVTF
jgi:hypothetical protein